MRDDLWIDHEKLQGLSGWSDRTIRWKADHEKLKWRYRQQRARNGRRVREYSVLSLPAEVQKKMLKATLATREEAPLALLPHADSHDTQISTFTLPPKIAAEHRLALTANQQRQADSRLEAIAPMLDFKNRTNGHRPAILLQDGREIRSLDDLAAYIAAQREISRATLWRWYSSFTKFGYAALADDVRRDKGLSRFFAAHPAVEKLVQAKYLSERLSIRLAYEAMCREFADIELPCYDTLRVYLKSISRAITILAREGSREFKARVECYVDRKPPDRVNQVWVSDHVQHDVWVRNIDPETGQTVFPGIALNEALRPWMTAWLDWRSRKIVGVAWCSTPSSNTISSALRVAILDCGIPEQAYVDNGKDYRKVRAGAAHELHEGDQIRSLSPECVGVLSRLQIQTVDCLPYHPQSKPIESWFGNRLHERFDTVWPTYCGTSAAKRPEQCDEALKQHRLFLAGKRSSSPLPTANEFVGLARWFIREYNSELPHSGRGMNGRTPDQVFAELGTNIRRLDDTDRPALDRLFWDRDRRRVGEGGCVRIYNQRYEPIDAQTAAYLYEQIERDVLVACDPTNLGEAIVMDIDGHVIGRLKATRLAEWGPASRDQYVASLRERRRAKRAVKEYVNGLSRGVETELEAMRRRAGIAPPTMLHPELPAPKQDATGAPALTEDLVEKYKAAMKTAGSARPKDIDDVVKEARAAMGN